MTGLCSIPRTTGGGPGPERRLVFIPDDRYTDAETALREAPGSLALDLGLIPGAEPGGVMRARIDAGKPLEAVLTGTDLAEPVAALPGFGEPVPL
jgi:hypothetical protein